MQDINEAYNILKNPITKQLYDDEYILYKQEASSTAETEYRVHNEDLENDIDNARKEASEYVRKFMNELKHETAVAGNAAWDAMKGYIFGAVIISVIVLLIRACSS